MAKDTKQETDQEVGFERWIHAQVTDEQLWNDFIEMAKTHQGGRSAFIRWLIAQEKLRRGAHWVTGEPVKTD